MSVSVLTSCTFQKDAVALAAVIHKAGRFGEPHSSCSHHLAILDMLIGMSFAMSSQCCVIFSYTDFQCILMQGCGLAHDD